MATDSQDSRRKHHHSSGDEAEETSKRRKHRHHHRRHHHHHRHSRRSSRKHDEGMREKEDVASSPPPSPIPVQAPMVAPDYDMEEGEIVEEEEGLVVKVKGDSEAESGEIETRELPHGSDAPNLGVDVEGHTSYREAPGELGQNFVLPVGKMSENNGRISEILGEDRNGDDMAIDLTVGTKDKEEYHRGKVETSEQKMLVGDGRGSNFNGHVFNDFCEEENRLHTASSPSENTEGGKVSEHSLSHAGYRKRVSTRKRSRSCDRARSRSQSRIILEEAGINDLKRDITLFAGNNRDVHDSGDQGLFKCKRDYGSGSRDMISYEVREHETGYGRYSGRGGGRHNHEARDRYRGERDRDRDRDRDREQDRDGNWEMEKDCTKQKERAHGSTEVEKDIRREKERVGRGDKDRERERECDRSRDRDRESEKERNRSRDREREKERGRSRDRDREREKERNKSRDREREKERDGSRELVKERDKDREEQRRSRDRASERERVREKERERGQSRDRDRGRYSERDKVHKNYKYENIDNHSGDRGNYNTSSRHSRHDEIEYHRDRTRKSDSENVYDVKNDSVKRGREKLKRDEDEQEDYLEKVASQLAEQEEEDLNRIKEESRRRRQAILEKYNTQPSKVQVESHSQEAGKDNEPGGDPARISAASSKIVTPEYVDDRSDRTDAYVTEPSFSIGKLPGQNGLPAFERTSGAGGLGEGTPKSERSEDMFCDDIFGESPAGVRKSGKGDGLPIEKSGLNDNWDDAEGYYSYRFGEILDGRYEITAAHGKGVFSAVVRAKDLKAGNGEPEEVAIKMIRNNDTMYKAGMQELIILKKLVGADPGNRRHCVRFISNFKYRNHLCLVFESLHMNLREVLKKFGRNIGLKLTAVRAYAKQLFIALKHLRNCGVLHCDIKPDNMLVNDAKNVLKLCDFGNAMFAGKNEITPYLVSRFYRAPEIILGLPYDHPLDIWSVGCCLYELYTGKVLFPGPSNNDMLRLHMELKGPFPKKMLRKGAFIDQHFDQDLNFHATEEDPVTKKTIKRLIINIKPKDIGTIITGSPGEDPKMLANFKDLLDKIFVLDPEKRMTVSQALNHPFITGYLPGVWGNPSLLRCLKAPGRRHSHWKCFAAALKRINHQ